MNCSEKTPKPCAPSVLVFNLNGDVIAAFVRTEVFLAEIPILPLSAASHLVAVLQRGESSAAVLSLISQRNEFMQ